MSGGRYIKQAIIAALCEHPEQEKYSTRAFSGENLHKVVEAMATEAHKLTKEDFFTQDDDNKFLIDTPGFWRNFDKIRDIIHANGDKFEMTDFTRSLSRDGKDQRHNLLENATNQNGLAKIFTADVWQGRFDEMERTWYRVKVPARKDLFRNDGLLDPALKRDMLKAEGRTSPEDGLAVSGVTPADLRAAFELRGNFEEVKRKLNANNDYFRKDYLLMPDASGDTVFWQKSAWDKFDDISRDLKKNNERFEVPDFIRQVGDRLNLLARAAEAQALPKIFAPQHWESRLQDMIDLWDHVKEGWRTSMSAKDFDLNYAQAESLTFAKRIDVKDIHTKADLLLPLETEGSAKSVIALGLKSTWENFSDIKARLDANGDKVTLDDLRAKSGFLDQSCLTSAAKFGHFSTVLEIARASNEPITLNDFLSRDRHGVSLLNILAERNELKLAFAPDLWAGRIADMKQLWSHVRSSDHKQVDIAQTEVAAKQATLKQQAKKKFQLPPAKKK